MVTVALQVGLNLNPPDNQISGTVTSSQWQSDLAAYRKVFNGTTDKANAYAARYTLVIPPVFGAPETSPGGYGAAGLTNNPAGMAALVGYLGDGAAFNQTVPISADGVMAVYASLYKGQGILLGWLTNAPPQPIAGTLNWVKLSGASKTFYAGGFTNQTDVISSFYKPPSTSKDVLNMTNATLTIAGGDLADPLVYTNVTVAGGKLTFSGPGNPTNQISAAFTAVARVHLANLIEQHGDVQQLARVPEERSEFSHKQWVPRVPRPWAPGISIRCKHRLQFECPIHL